MKENLQDTVKYEHNIWFKSDKIILDNYITHWLEEIILLSH